MCVCGGVDGGRWTDRRTSPNQFAPSTSLKLGGITINKCTSYGPDKLNLWPFYHLTFNLREQMFQIALLLLEDNNCAKLFWNPCTNVPVMARTSSIYYHFDLYLTPMNFTFNLPEKIFQMALLLLEDNNCAKLFWNPCINVHVIAGTSSIWPFWLLFDPCDLDLQPTWKNVLNSNFPPWRQQLCKIILKSMHKCTSYGPDKLNIWPFWSLFDPCNLDLQPT